MGAGLVRGCGGKIIRGATTRQPATAAVNVSPSPSWAEAEVVNDDAAPCPWLVAEGGLVSQCR
jgi:hypothetical protein